MNSLYSLERRRADDADLAAREHRLEHVGGVGRRAERRAGADHRVHFVDEQDQVRPLLDLADHVLDAILEHAAQHRPRHHRVHLQVDDLAVAQADRHLLRLELDAAREPFGNRRLADARLAEQQHGVGALAVAQDLEHPIHLGVAAEHRRNLVLARELIEVGREVLEERRQLEALLQPLLAQLVIAHPRGEPRDQRLGLDAVAADDRDRNALRLLEDGREEVRRLDRVAAAAAGVQQRQLEQQLGRRRDAQLAPGALGSSRRCSSSACRISWGFSSRSRMTWPNMSHSTWANARQTCSLVSSACSRRRASSSARSTTRSADSASLFCGMSKSSTTPSSVSCTGREQDGGQPSAGASRQPIAG